MFRKRLGQVARTALLLGSLALLLYPSASDLWNRLHQSSANLAYTGAVDVLDDESRQAMWDEAVAYNQMLLDTYRGIDHPEMPAYEDVLHVTDNGTMSVIVIPRVDLRSVVRHGTDEGMLQSYIGHLETSSLPVGGEGSHCVIVGHRGLPSARLFTDLDELEEGDLFMLETLGQVLTYEVDQIKVVLPTQVDELRIREGEDLCTLVTCTPYGVNSHRLLVRGHRVPTPEDYVPTAAVSLGAQLIRPLFALLGLVLAALTVLVVARLRRRRCQGATAGQERRDQRFVEEEDHRSAEVRRYQDASGKEGDSSPGSHARGRAHGGSARPRHLG